MQKVIIDSDWGGDVLQLASVVLSRPSEYEVLGATVTFGNASLKQNLQNAGAILKLLGVDQQVPRFTGAAAPTGFESQPEGDDAHGRTGLGKAILEPSGIPPAEGDAVDFLLNTLAREEPKSVILVATGPQTNVAQAIRKAPDLVGRLKEIRIMGGCVDPLPGYRVDENLSRTSGVSISRKGNITEWAEFNFQQAPEDARFVFESGIQISLFPMNCTHQLCFTKEREKRFGEVLGSFGEISEQLLYLLKAPEAMDQAKFGIAPVMHDLNTTVSMIHPDLYLGERGKVGIVMDGERAGESRFEADSSGPHWVCREIVDTDRVFEELLSSLKRLLASAK